MPQTTAGIQYLDRIAVTVNDDIITENEIDRIINSVKQQSKKKTNANDLKKQITEQLIDQRLILQIAAKTGITVEESKVTAAIKDIAKRNHLNMAQFKKKIQEKGNSFDSFRKHVRKQLLISKVQSVAVGKNITVNDAEINTFKTSLKSRHPKITEYHVQNILIPLPDPANKKEIKSAKKKAIKLLKQLRQQPNVNSNKSSDLGWRTQDNLPEIFVKQIISLKVDQYSDPIHAANGFHLIHLTGKRERPTTLNISDMQIRQMLWEKKFQTKFKEWLTQLRSTAYIHYAQQ